MELISVILKNLTNAVCYKGGCGYELTKSNLRENVSGSSKLFLLTVMKRLQFYMYTHTQIVGAMVAALGYHCNRFWVFWFFHFVKLK